MIARAWLGSTALVLLASTARVCSDDASTSPPASPPPSATVVPTAVSRVSVANPPVTRAWPANISAEDRKALYHLTEGSDLIPLAWIFALESSKTHKPFMEGLDRFGLLPDPESKEHLPIGMSSATPVDLAFLGAPMVGFNCAACHVGRLERGGSSLTILGAPNMFDIKGFYAELFESAGDTLKSLPKMIDFVRAVLKYPATPKPILAAKPDSHFESFATTVPDLDELDTKGESGKQLAARLKQVHQEELDRPADDPKVVFAKSMPHSGNEAVPMPFADLTTPAQLDKLQGPALKKSLAKHEESAMLVPTPEVATAPVVVPEFIGEVVATMRLLKSRMQLLATVAELKPDSVVPGPGRVDAFGTARNLMFGASTAQPTDAPVCYPHLWGFGDLPWLHWDANTDSIMERNIGQAIGLGAIIDASTGLSTVVTVNIHRLEDIARKLPPPAWDADIFGAIDREKAKRGAEIYGKYCKGCHEGAERANGMSVEEIGTDPNRARGFGRKLGADEFAVRLHSTLEKVEVTGFKREGVSDADAKAWAGKSDWRTTGRYAARSLAGVWASPPYLHNGSVPTLWDLLTPQEKRPSKFPVGHREYDATKLGYSTTFAAAPSQFDATSPGNLNTGHSGDRYGTSLGDDEKWALVEYLKTLGSEH